MYRLLVLFLALWAAPVLAQPVAADFDAAHLTRQNFYQVLAPVARREGTLVFYNFAGDFDPVWKQGLIPAFEARYGVHVVYRNVSLALATQQLIAVSAAHAPAPVDAFFAGGPDHFHALDAAGALSPLPLADLLPNLAAVPDAYKNRVFGVATGGRWPIVHRSQAVLAYDSAVLPAGQVPTDFDALLQWAQQHPHRFAMTSPAKDGSGKAFLYAAALDRVKDAACARTLRDAGLDEAHATHWAAGAACLAPVWDYMQRLARVSEITNGNADTLNLLANHAATLGTSWEDLVLTFVRDRLLPPTTRSTLIGGGLVAGGDGLVLPARARHNAAALLFIDMAFGRDFQAWKLEHHGSLSPRPDVTVDAISADTARYMVPAPMAARWSVPANWAMASALARVFQDRLAAAQ